MSYRTLEGLSPALFGDTKLRERMAATHSVISVALRTLVTRRDLADLDDRALEDVGLTRADALAEAKRQPWDLEPRHPRKRRGPAPRMVATWLMEAARRWQSRRAIAHLDARMLRDIGVSYAEAESEVNKPFWRL
jgi:uncharacterized protein YjiS (DUF1127 family)